MLIAVPDIQNFNDPNEIHSLLKNCPALNEVAIVRYEHVLKHTKDRRRVFPSAENLYTEDQLRFAIVDAYSHGFVDAVQSGATNPNDPLIRK